MTVAALSFDDLLRARAELTARKKAIEMRMGPQGPMSDTALRQFYKNRAEWKTEIAQIDTDLAAINPEIKIRNRIQLSARQSALYCVADAAWNLLQHSGPAPELAHVLAELAATGWSPRRSALAALRLPHRSRCGLCGVELAADSPAALTRIREAHDATHEELAVTDPDPEIK